MVAGTAASAGEVRYALVEHDSGEYRFHLSMLVQAPPDRVFALLADHDRLHLLSDVLVASARLPGAADKAVRRRLVARTCILFFCFRVAVVEDAETFPQRRILAVMVPGQGDFSWGRTEWQVNEMDAGRSEVRYRSELRPGFWIPPFIGPYLLKRKMIREAQDVILNLEAPAGGDDPNG